MVWSKKDREYIKMVARLGAKHQQIVVVDSSKKKVKGS